MHFYCLDALTALLVTGLMFRTGFDLLKQSGRVFLEAAPKGMDPEAIDQTLAAGGTVLEVHDLPRVGGDVRISSPVSPCSRRG